MRETIDEILGALDESLPKTNSFLASGVQPFTMNQAHAFVYEAVGRVMAGHTDSMETMGIVVRAETLGREDEPAATVLLRLGTIYPRRS